MKRPSAALVVASLALAAALAPPAYSAIAPKLPKNSVGSPQIKDKSIRSADLGTNVVTSSKIGAGQVKHSDLAHGSVDFTTIADGTVGRGELSANSVDGSKIVSGSVAYDDLASPVVAGGWTFFPDSDVPIAQDGTAGFGSLSANGGGPIALNRPATLVVNGIVYAQAADTHGATDFKGRLTCTLAVDGAAVLPQSLLRIEQTDEATLPVAATVNVQPGTHDVSLSCHNPTNAAVTMDVGRVSVNVVAVPR
jgi:hypothetical protein